MDSFVEIRQVLRILLRRWWMLLVAVLVAGIIGYAFSRTQIPVYTASTTLYVGRSMQSSDLDRMDLQVGTQLALTYVNLVRRKPVLQGAIDALNLLGSWQDLRKRVEVSQVENTQLLEIRVKASSPSEAQMTADEIAHQLTLIGPVASGNTMSEETRKFALQRLDRLKLNMEAAQRQIDERDMQISTLILTAIDKVPDLQAEIKELEAVVVEWDSTYATLLASLSIEPSSNYLAIVETADANPTPIQPRTKLNILIAMVVGLVLAAVLVFLLEYLDDMLKPVDLVNHDLGISLLANISPTKSKTLLDKLILRQDLFSPASEDYRLLRNKVHVMCADWPRKVIMVTSPTPGELRSITVANLGIVLAQGGGRVIIVDTNLRHPLQHTLFEFPMEMGLTDLLYGPDLEPSEVLQYTNVEGLQVLPVGGLQPPHPSELLGSAHMGLLLNQLAQQADYVLCDSAHAVAIADAVELSKHVDGVMLVVEMGKTRRDTAEQAVRNLRQAGAILLGAILSPLSAHKIATTRFTTPVVRSRASSTA